MQVATWLTTVVFAYGLGLFWYDLLPAKLPDMPWRVAAYPFALMVIGEAFIGVGPTFMDIHVGTAVIAALVGVVIDWLVTSLRQPQAIATPEMRRAAMQS